MTIYLASGWQRLHLYQGAPSPFDLNDGSFHDTRVHSVQMHPGDCVYIPAYWFQQLQTEKEAVVAVTYTYESSSTWLTLIEEGIKQSKV